MAQPSVARRTRWPGKQIQRVPDNKRRGIGQQRKRGKQNGFKRWVNIWQRTLAYAHTGGKLLLHFVLCLFVVELLAQPLSQDGRTRIESAEIRVAFADQINRIPRNHQMQR